MPGLHPPTRLRLRLRAGATVLAALALLTATAPAGRAALTPPVGSGQPSITGTPPPQVGETLGETHGMWAPAPDSYTYQWLRCDATGGTCLAITGASAPTYGVAAADIGATLRVTETGVDSAGPAMTPLRSAQTGVVVAAPVPTLVTAPSIAGAPVAGQTLTETHGTWTNAPTAYAVQWVDCDAAAGGACAPIAGATAQTYAAAASDVGHTIRVFEVAINSGGTSGPAGSAPTAVVAPPPVAPKNAASPVVSGLPQVGSTLSCSTGTWNGTPPITYTYQWLGDGNPIGGATGPSHLLAATDVAQAVACAVTATNVAGSATEKSDSVNVTAAVACGGLAGAAHQRCRARLAYDLARTRCRSISTRTSAGRGRRAVCEAKAKLTYKRAVAVARCQSIKSQSKRAACVARARRIKR